MEKVSAGEGSCVNDFTVTPGSTGVTDFSIKSVSADQLPLTGSASFKLDDIRISGVGMPVTTKVQPQFSVGRPPNTKYVQVHQSPDHSIITHIINAGKESGVYLPIPQTWDGLRSEPTFQIRLLVVATTAQRELFVWPLRLPGANGRTDPWMESEQELAERAKGRWIRVMSNMEISRYEGREAQGDLPEPEWPDMTFEEMLKNAFRERMITSLDHPVLKRLRGEIV